MSYFKIDIKPFIYGIEQRFDIWLQRFGRAVDAALTIDASPAQKTAAYLHYLPTKLESSENNADWAEFRTGVVGHTI